jgi:hypothetical protein
MHQIVVLLTLGFLAVWTIGPFAFFIVYHIPPLRRFVGLDASIKWAEQAREHSEKLERRARRPQEDAGMVRRDVDGRNLPTRISPHFSKSTLVASAVELFWFRKAMIF